MLCSCVYKQALAILLQEHANYRAIDGVVRIICTLQELDYEAKIKRLHQDFPDIDIEQLDIFLGAAEGVYDTAFAHLLQSAEERQHQVSSAHACSFLTGWCG